jgi:hypothetical protein
MNKQSQRLVMTTSVMSSAFHTGDENMKVVEKESQQVWKCNRTKVFAQGEKSPFVSSVLVAGMGDPIPDVEFEKPKKKAVKKVENKAVKPSEDK